MYNFYDGGEGVREEGQDEIEVGADDDFGADDDVDVEVGADDDVDVEADVAKTVTVEVDVYPNT